MAGFSHIQRDQAVSSSRGRSRTAQERALGPGSLFHPCWTSVDGRQPEPGQVLWRELAMQITASLPARAHYSLLS